MQNGIQICFWRHAYKWNKNRTDSFHSFVKRSKFILAQTYIFILQLANYKFLHRLVDGFLTHKKSTRARSKGDKVISSALSEPREI